MGVNADGGWQHTNVVIWRMDGLNDNPVPANTTTEWFAGSVSAMFRARISTPVTGGTVTVLAVRPEEQRGMPAPPFVVGSVLI